VIQHANRTPPRLIVDTGSVTSLALFDLDNTLLNREKAFARWTQQFLAVHELGEDACPTIERADADGRNPRDRFFSELRGELGITTSIDQLLADYGVDYPSKYTAEPDVVNALRSLRTAEFKVGVVTNGPPSQWSKFEAAGIEDEFDAVCISSTTGAHKPDLAIFQAAADLCGLPLDGWMVGDSPEADIAGGLAAGLRTIWMSRGRPWGGFAYSPEFTASSIPEAVEIILRLG
jgi:HAD superfamily hydrolase (TIGR01509 family)